MRYTQTKIKNKIERWRRRRRKKRERTDSARFFHRHQAVSMRKISSVCEISKITQPSIVVSTVVNVEERSSLLRNGVMPANDRPNNSQNPRPSVCESTTSLTTSLAFVRPTRRKKKREDRSSLVVDLCVEDLWHIGNTRRPQFTAHYLARSPPRFAFSSASVIHRRRLLFASCRRFLSPAPRSLSIGIPVSCAISSASSSSSFYSFVSFRRLSI